MFSCVDERRKLFVHKPKACKFDLGVCFHHSLDLLPFIMQRKALIRFRLLSGTWASLKEEFGTGKCSWMRNQAKGSVANQKFTVHVFQEKNSENQFSVCLKACFIFILFLPSPFIAPVPSSTSSCVALFLFWLIPDASKLLPRSGPPPTFSQPAGEDSFYFCKWLEAKLRKWKEIQVSLFIKFYWNAVTPSQSLTYHQWLLWSCKGIIEPLWLSA